MHHGYYPKGGAPKSNQQAQIDMIEETLKWAGVTGAKKVGGCPGPPAALLPCAARVGCEQGRAGGSISAPHRAECAQPRCRTRPGGGPALPMLPSPCQMVDVGCGIGGSSRHISRKFGCEARGITLSPFQAGPRPHRPSIPAGEPHSLAVPIPATRHSAAWSRSTLANPRKQPDSAGVCVVSGGRRGPLLDAVASRASTHTELARHRLVVLPCRQRVPTSWQRRRGWETSCNSRWQVRPQLPLINRQPQLATSACPLWLPRCRACRGARGCTPATVQGRRRQQVQRAQVPSLALPWWQNVKRCQSQRLAPSRPCSADALQQPFADGEFDLVWSMESGEHMPGRRRACLRMHRTAAWTPGGRRARCPFHDAGGVGQPPFMHGRPSS